MEGEVRINMSENDIAEMEIEKFNENINSFIEASKAYSQRNVKIKGIAEDKNIKDHLNKMFGDRNDSDYLEVEVSMAIPKEILMSLYDIIQNFVQICETHGFIKKLSSRESKFLSGVKFVNNVIKHRRKDFDITDLIVPDNKVETQYFNQNQHGVMTIPLEDVEFRLAAKWTAVKSEISNKMRHKDQFINYKRYLQDYDVIDTIIDAKKIIDCHSTK
jgi:hypothetical protein